MPYFKELKHSHLSGNLSSENFSRLPIYLNGYIPFCFTDFNKSPLNYYGKYLKSLSDKSLINASRLEFINS